MESLCLPKINAKMPTRSKRVRWARSWVIQKFICITASVNPGTLKLEEATTGSVQKNRFAWKFGVFYCQFYEIFENTFLQKTCFWWRSLLVKNFNSVLLIFLNSQLYHAPLEWWLLFWCNQEHFLIKKTWLNFK